MKLRAKNYLINLDKFVSINYIEDSNELMINLEYLSYIIKMNSPYVPDYYLDEISKGLTQKVNILTIPEDRVESVKTAMMVSGNIEGFDEDEE